MGCGRSLAQRRRPHTLATGGPNDCFPDWAPSGTHFLFSAGSPASYEIVDQEASGGGFSRRLIATGRPLQPRWSPDGSRFVFVDKGLEDRLMLGQCVRWPCRPAGQDRRAERSRVVTGWAADLLYASWPR